MEENQSYRWVTHGRYTCERCNALDGKEMSLANWRSSVLPGMHAGCDCSLEPLDEVFGREKQGITSLKVSEPKHGALKTGVDKRLSVSHGALKPAVKKVKAVLPSVNNRPLNIIHSGGKNG
jgi:hypothetical protein